MIKIYKNKKPATIKAIKWTGNNTDQIMDFGCIEYKSGNKSETYFHVEIPPIETKEPELWVSNFYGGDCLHIGEYLVLDDDFYVMNENELSKEWKYIGNNKYEQVDSRVFSIIQWTGSNTEECKKFLNGFGGLDTSGQQFLIMNSVGGSVCNKGDYLLEANGEYYAADSKYIKDNFKEV